MAGVRVCMCNSDVMCARVLLMCVCARDFQARTCKFGIYCSQSTTNASESLLCIYKKKKEFQLVQQSMSKLLLGRYTHVHQSMRSSASSLDTDDELGVGITNETAVWLGPTSGSASARDVMLFEWTWIIERICVRQIGQRSL
jgi:hypothetical protein